LHTHEPACHPSVHNGDRLRNGLRMYRGICLNIGTVLHGLFAKRELLKKNTYFLIKNILNLIHKHGTDWYYYTQKFTNFTIKKRQH
jgi:hypothetical protein